jgi:hypothetical protein
MDAFKTCVVSLMLLFVSAVASADPRSPLQTGSSVTSAVAPDVWLGRLAGRYTVEGLVSAVDVRLVEVVAREGCAYCVTAWGTADCIRIGTGPGVQCVLDVRWEEMYEIVQPAAELPGPGEPPPPMGGSYELPGGVPHLSPAMMLFGLDPEKQAILHLVVNNKSLSEGGPGFVAGNRATFKTTCVNGPRLMAAMKPPPKPPAPPDYDVVWHTCERIVRIDAKADANVVFLMVELAINDDPFTLINLTLRRVPGRETGG